MSARAFAWTVAAVCVALVLAQYVVPAWSGFHTWQYAAALALGLIALFAYLNDARRGRDGEVGARSTVAVVGVIVIDLAGMATGLLGPDSITYQRTPGTVLPLPDLGRAAFFTSADAAQMTDGQAPIVLRARSGETVSLVAGQRRLIDATMVEASARMAVYVEATDARGNRVTITQPTNPTFLSPVLFFDQTVGVAGKDLPADAFATPALKLQISALYFSPRDAAEQSAHGLSGSRAALLFAVHGDDGKLIPRGIGFAPSGATVSFGIVRLRPTIGSYPVLIASPVPSPPAIALGLACIAGGLIYALWRRPSDAPAEVPSTPSNIGAVEPEPVAAIKT